MLKVICPAWYWINYRSLISNCSGCCTVELKCLDVCRSHVAIGIVYRAPTADSSRTLQHTMSCLDCLIHTHSYAGVVLLGDFSLLTNPSTVSYPLKQVVEGATRKTAILDKIFTNIACWYDQPMSRSHFNKHYNCSDHF